MTPPVSTSGLRLLDRRGFLGHSASGLGGIALAGLLADEGLLGAEPIRPVIDPASPHAARPSHFQAKAKNVLVIFCAGAVSQLETWDWKPELVTWDGKPVSLIALLASPSNSTQEHMQALTTLSRLIMNEKAYQGLIDATDAESLYSIAVESANGR